MELTNAPDRVITEVRLLCCVTSRKRRLLDQGKGDDRRFQPQTFLRTGLDLENSPQLALEKPCYRQHE